MAIERRSPPFDPMDLVTFRKQVFRKISSILAGNASD
jgi:hypothetical protein